MGASIQRALSSGGASSVSLQSARCRRYGDPRADQSRNPRFNPSRRLRADRSRGRRPRHRRQLLQSHRRLLHRRVSGSRTDQAPNRYVLVQRPVRTLRTPSRWLAGMQVVLPAKQKLRDLREPDRLRAAVLPSLVGAIRRGLVLERVPARSQAPLREAIDRRQRVESPAAELVELASRTR